MLSLTQSEISWYHVYKERKIHNKDPKLRESGMRQPEVGCCPAKCHPTCWYFLLAFMQGRIASYYYNVSADGNYNERLIPPSPPRSSPAVFPQPHMVPLIDESWPRALAHNSRRRVNSQASRISHAPWLLWTLACILPNTLHSKADWNVSVKNISLLLLQLTNFPWSVEFPPEKAGRDLSIHNEARLIGLRPHCIGAELLPVKNRQNHDHTTTGRFLAMFQALYI